MKIPLLYQRTEYDCGPTALLNAISFLFDRKEIPPDVVKYVMMYSMDTFDSKCAPCREGTSPMAMMFLSNWLNQYSKVGSFPLTCEYLSGEDVRINDHSHIISALQQNGAVLLRVWDEVEHYITLTGIQGDYILFFDPYYEVPFPLNEGIELIDDQPYRANRRIKKELFHREGYYQYSIDKVEHPEAVLIFNEKTRMTPERSVEYFL